MLKGIHEASTPKPPPEPTAMEASDSERLASLEEKMDEVLRRLDEMSKRESSTLDLIDRYLRKHI